MINKTEKTNSKDFCNIGGNRILAEYLYYASTG